MLLISVTLDETHHAAATLIAEPQTLFGVNDKRRSSDFRARARTRARIRSSNYDNDQHFTDKEQGFLIRSSNIAFQKALAELKRLSIRVRKNIQRLD